MGKDLEVFRKVAAAIGESLESVCAMQDKERKELMEVLGLEVENLTLMSNHSLMPFFRWRSTMRFLTVTTSPRRIITTMTTYMWTARMRHLLKLWQPAGLLLLKYLMRMMWKKMKA